MNHRVGSVTVRAISSLIGAYVGASITIVGAGFWLVSADDSRAFEAQVVPETPPSMTAESSLLPPSDPRTDDAKTSAESALNPPQTSLPNAGNTTESGEKYSRSTSPGAGQLNNADHGPVPSLQIIFAEAEARRKEEQKRLIRENQNAAAALAATAPSASPSSGRDSQENNAAAEQQPRRAMNQTEPNFGGFADDSYVISQTGSNDVHISVMRRPGYPSTVSRKRTGAIVSVKPALKPFSTFAVKDPETAPTPTPSAQKPVAASGQPLTRKPIAAAPRPADGKPNRTGKGKARHVLPALKPSASRATGQSAQITEDPRPEITAVKQPDTKHQEAANRQTDRTRIFHRPNATDWIPAGNDIGDLLTTALNNEEPREISRKNIKMNRGDTLMKVLLKQGAERQDAHAAITALKTVYDPRNLRAGQKISVLFDQSAEKKIPLLEGIRVATAADKRVIVSRLDSETFAATEERATLERKFRRSRGRISDSLFVTAKRVGLPAQVLFEFIQLYSFDVDFQREIHPGDFFDVLYEAHLNDDGKVVKYGNILFAAIETQGDVKSLYRHKLADGKYGYFSEDGIGVRRALMRTPVDGARLTSGFGMRRHPVLRYTRMHRGLDFAAPRGTPVMAAGSGTIEVLGRQGGYGRYIRIRHNGEYQTAYAHLNGYAKGLKRGKSVKQGQIIGYVGRSGRVTGTHLHYEVLKNGRQINPLKLRLPKGKRLRGRELERFADTLDNIQTIVAATQPTQRVAQN